MTSANISDNYSQEFTIHKQFNSGIISKKFNDQYRKPLPINLFLFTSVIDVMSIFRTQQGFFPLFLLHTAKPLLTVWTGKYQILLSSSLAVMTA